LELAGAKQTEEQSLTLTLDARAERQMKRLGEALAHQTAPVDAVSEIDGVPVVVARFDEAPGHFQKVKRMARIPTSS